jgi:hypothetical protein
LEVSKQLRCLGAAFLLAALLACFVPGIASAATVLGSAFQDQNRDGVQQADEPQFAGHRIDLYNGADAFLATTLTDASGRYQFPGLTDGDYTVRYDASYWWNLRDDWVPTTTGSLFPQASVHLAGSGVADFGWRRIARSTDVNAPISRFVGSNGLEVSSYDDVVSAREVYDALMKGSLIGEEASTITIRFDYGSGSTTTSSVTQSNGKYVGYRANALVSYASWLDNADRALFHEYGHAWSRYYGYMVQQDSALSGYLAARALANDPRLGTSYAWSVDEIIAEDYRQLFGTANARTGGQINGEIPLAPDVSGLRDYLAGPFRQALTQPVAPATPLTISGMSVTPSPVTTSGTVSFSISAPASVTVKILNPKGSLVRTLVSNTASPAGPVTSVWNRTDAAGRRVKRGSYKAAVEAVDAGAKSVSASVSFSVY